MISNLSYNKTLASQLGEYEFIGYSHTSKGTSCSCCGTPINNLYKVKNLETREQIYVGSECLKHLLGENESIRITKAVKSIETNIKNTYEKALKNEWLKVIIISEKDNLDKNIYDNCIWRVNNDTNPTETIKKMKEWERDNYFTEYFKNNKFKLTKEQKEEVKNLQLKEVEIFIEKLNSIKLIPVYKQKLIEIDKEILKIHNDIRRTLNIGDKSVLIEVRSNKFTEKEDIINTLNKLERLQRSL